MTLKELVFTEGHVVVLQYEPIVDGNLVYKLFDSRDDHLSVELLRFTVPHEDLRGATFLCRDSPKMFMRWIRKELQRQEDEKALIEQARKDWAEGKQS